MLAAMEEASAEEVRKQFDTNVFGLLNVIRALLPHMRKQGSGHVINISSLFAYLNNLPGLGIYGATKYAVEGLSEGLAIELQPLGIQVTAVAPGLFSTEFASANSYQSAAVMLDAYNETVGVTRASLGDFHGNQPGDPAKLAQVIIKLAASEKVPLYLPVRRDSVKSIREKIALITKEVDEWETVSTATDHERLAAAVFE